MTTKISMLLTAGALLLCTAGAMASSPFQSYGNHGTEITDWRYKWQSITDKSHHPIWSDISSFLQECGAGAFSANDIHLYQTDIDSDGLDDVILDSSALNGRKARGTCVQGDPCIDGKCFVTLYRLRSQPTRLPLTEAPKIQVKGLDGKITEKTAVCPPTAAMNTDCLSYCSATPQQCPQLFDFDYKVVTNDRLARWFLIDNANVVLRNSLYQWVDAAANNATSKPVLARSGDLSCSAAELLLHAQECVKYSQYLTPALINKYGRAMGDMYTPEIKVSATVLPASSLALGYTTDVTQEKVAGVKTYYYSSVTGLEDPSGLESPVQKVRSQEGLRSKPVLFNKLKALNNSNVAVTGDISDGIRLPPQQSGMANVVAIERDPLENNGVSYGCREIINFAPFPINARTEEEAAKNDVYLPTKVLTEVMSFGGLESVAKDASLANLFYVRPCSPKWTYWITTTLGSTSIASTPEALCPPSDQIACGTSITLVVERFCRYPTGSDAASIALCGGGRNIDTVICSGPTCPTTSGDCIAPSTSVLLPGGASKPAQSLMAGDAVMGFKKGSKDLHETRVHAVVSSVAEGSATINGVQMTGNHPVYLPDGSTVRADAVTKGQTIVGADGQPVVVESVVLDTKKENMTNLILEGTDGFVAGGIRVGDKKVQDKLVAPEKAVEEKQ